MFFFFQTMDKDPDHLILFNCVGNAVASIDSEYSVKKLEPSVYLSPESTVKQNQGKFCAVVYYS